MDMTFRIDAMRASLYSILIKPEHVPGLREEVSRRREAIDSFLAKMLCSTRVLSSTVPMAPGIVYQWSATWTDGEHAEVAFAETKKDAQLAGKQLQDLHPEGYGVIMVGRVQAPGGAGAEIGEFLEPGRLLVRRRLACAPTAASSSASVTLGRRTRRRSRSTS